MDVPNKVLEMFGPWAAVILGVFALLWLARFIVKDIYPGLKSLTVITDSVSGIPKMKQEVIAIASSVVEISSSVNDITETVKTIPDIEKRLTKLEDEFIQLKMELGLSNKKGMF